MTAESAAIAAVSGAIVNQLHRTANCVAIETSVLIRANFMNFAVSLSLNFELGFIAFIHAPTKRHYLYEGFLDLVKSLNILALDSAANACSVAVWAKNNVCAARLETMERGQAEALAPMVAAVVEEANSAIPGGLAELDGVAVTTGPGTFTGVRIGLAMAKALALPCGIPVIGLSTFDAIRWEIGQEKRPLLAAIETKRDDFYVQLFDRGGVATMEGGALSTVEILRLLPDEPIGAIGDGAPRLAEELTANGYNELRIIAEAPPIAESFIGLAVERYRLGDFGVPAPLYLKAPSVTPQRDR